MNCTRIGRQFTASRRDGGRSGLRTGQEVTRCDTRNQLSHGRQDSVLPVLPVCANLGADRSSGRYRQKTLFARRLTGRKDRLHWADLTAMNDTRASGAMRAMRWTKSKLPPALQSPPLV